jgi:hypothetical protein
MAAGPAVSGCAPDQYHGVEGFRRMSHAEGIYVQPGPLECGRSHAPAVRRGADAMLRLMLR